MDQINFFCIENHYKTVHRFWPKFWPKKSLILTEFSHFDRNFDRLCSVKKTLVEIFFWPVGQKILTEILTDWQSVKIQVWPKFWPKVGQKASLTEIWTEKFGQNFMVDRILTNFSVKIMQPKFRGELSGGKMVTEIGQKVSVKIIFWPISVTIVGRNCKILTDFVHNFGRNLSTLDDFGHNVGQKHAFFTAFRKNISHQKKLKFKLRISNFQSKFLKTIYFNDWNICFHCGNKIQIICIQT